MRFLVDAQLPPALARWRTEAGHDAEHVGDRGMQAAPDTAIWDRAMRNRAAIITLDSGVTVSRIIFGRPSRHVWAKRAPKDALTLPG